MAYNREMTQITLALPYAIPPAQLAPDLIRTLQAPSLATLLSRHSTLQTTAFSGDARVLPHEAWLSGAVGRPSGAGIGAPLATAAMQGLGLDAEAREGYWFMVQPSHVQLARTHMLLTDQRQLRLSDEDARALFDSARPCFEDAGLTLIYAQPELWFVRADAWTGLDTASPDAALDQNLSDWLPQGDAARACRKLQNEVQMVWFEHPVNLAREQRGLRAVNSVWMWGGAQGTPDLAGSTTPLATANAATWLSAVATPALRNADAANLLNHLPNHLPDHAGNQSALALLDMLIAPAIAGDWAEWLTRLQHIETAWLAPLLAALKDGRIRSVSLLLNHRDTTLRADCTRMSLHKFWRKPSLNALLDHT